MTIAKINSINATIKENRYFASPEALMRGEIALATRPHSAWGGAVTAQIYLPIARSQAWTHLTNYPRWVQYFPDLIHSEVISKSDDLNQNTKRIYQVASKAFLFFNAQAEIYLKVIEILQHQIQFRLEKGSFIDFTADLKMHDCYGGTVVTYSVQATPSFPVPSIFIEQAINLELPANLRQMRHVICGS